LTARRVVPSIIGLDIQVPPVAVRVRCGLELRCRGWRREGLLRLLENTVENGERSAELVAPAPMLDPGHT
jgi:hypothetical protein